MTDGDEVRGIHELDFGASIEKYLRQGYEKDTSAVAAARWIRERANYDRDVALNRLQSIKDMTASSKTKEARGVHALASQTLAQLEQLPNRELRDSAPPNKDGDHFSAAYLPAYKAQVEAGVKESVAKMGAAVQSVEHMMKNHKAFGKHKMLVFQHAEEAARQRQGDVEPDITTVYAACYNAKTTAKKVKDVDGALVEAVVVKVLCGWEGHGQDEIHPDKLTWQFDEDFISGAYRGYTDVMSKFMTAFNDNAVVKESGMKWGIPSDKRIWLKKDKHVVVCVPGYEWVAKHASIKQTLVVEKKKKAAKQYDRGGEAEDEAGPSQ